jgi:hypothetical protein
MVKGSLVDSLRRVLVMLPLRKGSLPRITSTIHHFQALDFLLPAFLQECLKVASRREVNPTLGCRLRANQWVDCLKMDFPPGCNPPDDRTVGLLGLSISRTSQIRP